MAFAPLLVFSMPTFDFINFVRKIVAGAVSAVASPITAVLAGAGLLATFLDEIVSFFSDDFEIPTIAFEGFDFPQDCEQFVRVFLYAIDFDTLHSIINWVVVIAYSLIGFSLRYIVSLVGILCAVGVYRVVRKQLKDVMG